MARVGFTRKSATHYWLDLSIDGGRDSSLGVGANRLLPHNLDTGHADTSKNWNQLPLRCPYASQRQDV